MEGLREKIKFIVFEKGTNENGFPINKDIIKYECRANLKHLNGKEYYASLTTNNKFVVSFRVRYCKAIRDIMNMNSEKYSIEYNNKKYNVVYVYNINNEHHFVDFKCEVTNE